MPIVITHGFGNAGLSILLGSLFAGSVVSLFICLIKELLTICLLFLRGKTLPYLLMLGRSHLRDYVPFHDLAGCIIIWK